MKLKKEDQENYNREEEVEEDNLKHKLSKI